MQKCSQKHPVLPILAKSSELFRWCVLGGPKIMHIFNWTKKILYFFFICFVMSTLNHHRYTRSHPFIAETKYLLMKCLFTREFQYNVKIMLWAHSLYSMHNLWLSEVPLNLSVQYEVLTEFLPHLHLSLLESSPSHRGAQYMKWHEN